MSGTARFVCTDPDAGDFAFADVDAVLDALEAALVRPATPMFDAARQSWQPVGLHPEVRAAWAARLRYRPPSGTGLRLPELPSRTALSRSLPDDVDERERRRAAFGQVRAPLPAIRRASTRGREGDEAAPRFAAAGVVWVVVLLALAGWAVIAFAGRLTEFAAASAGMTERK